MTAIRTRL